MKQGKTLMQLAAEIERRSDAKADYIAPANKIAAAVERQGGSPVLTLDLSGAAMHPHPPHDWPCTQTGLCVVCKFLALAGQHNQQEQHHAMGYDDHEGQARALC